MGLNEKNILKSEKINKVILFGGSQLLFELVKQLMKEILSIQVYTSPRHYEEVVTKDGKTLEEVLKDNCITVTVTDDINKERSLYNIDKHTLGIGLGEAWSFNQGIIDCFDGRLLDFMGIPLPRYRGGAHYTWAILKGDRNWSCNLQVINTDMIQGVFDSGEIVDSGQYIFDDTCRIPQDYFDFAIKKEVEFIVNFIKQLNNGKEFELKEIDESKSMHFPRLNTVKQAWIDWSWSGEDIERFVCAFDSPYKGAGTYLDGVPVRLKSAALDKKEAFHPYQSGLVIQVLNREIIIATSSGELVVKEVYDESGNLINNSIKLGMRFFTPSAQLEFSKEFKAEYGAKGLKEEINKVIGKDDIIKGDNISLRLVSQEDCTPRYAEWLEDREVNRYLETRWSKQNVESIKAFVQSMIDSPDNYLFAIVENCGGTHIGNIKIGPINRNHSFADVSYFIGEKSAWGKGYATEAIKLITKFGFTNLNLHRIQAGAYEGNLGSDKCLKKAGYKLEGCFRKQLFTENGWEDHLFYGILRQDWEAENSCK